MMTSQRDAPERPKDRNNLCDCNQLEARALPRVARDLMYSRARRQSTPNTGSRSGGADMQKQNAQEFRVFTIEEANQVIEEVSEMLPALRRQLREMQLTEDRLRVLDLICNRSVTMNNPDLDEYLELKIRYHDQVTGHREVAPRVRGEGVPPEGPRQGRGALHREAGRGLRPPLLERGRGHDLPTGTSSRTRPARTRSSASRWTTGRASDRSTPRGPAGEPDATRSARPSGGLLPRPGKTQAAPQYLLKDLRRTAGLVTRRFSVGAPIAEADRSPAGTAGPGAGPPVRRRAARPLAR